MPSGPLWPSEQLWSENDLMNDLPIVDQNQIERLSEWGGAALQRKMIELFLSGARERVDQLREGLAAGNRETAERAAHTLKSSAGNVGAQRLQMLAQEAENLAGAEKMGDLETLFPSLEQEFQTACQALKSIMEGIVG